MIIFDRNHNIIFQDPENQTNSSSFEKIILPADTAGKLNHDNGEDPVTGTAPGHAVSGNFNSTGTIPSGSFTGKILYGSEDPPDVFYGDKSIRFPYNFLSEQAKRSNSQNDKLITEYLRDGEKIPSHPFDADWITVPVIISAFIYSSLRAFPGKLTGNVKAFLLFKGIGAPSSREKGAFFNWHSGLVNLVSFSSLALFLYLATDYHDFIPFGIRGAGLWLLLLSLTALLITIRIIICFILGMISGQKTIFGEYAASIFQSYHIAGFLLYIISVLLVYTSFFPPAGLLNTGFILIALIYLMRIFRLFLIFLKRGVSIFYLILYLCALEFLPALIVLRYLTNLF
ncbi:MAG: DUF4271 domain-containing protein [Bacteroidales bacterium]|nr:DUF4271 domain-containing protein [Bacteroidales bacterium]